MKTTATARVNLVAIIVLLASMAGAMATLYAVDHQRYQAVAQGDLYIRSSKVLRRMSLGYTGLLADIYWTRAVQYFGEQHHHESGDFRLLAPLLEVTTELDPKLLPAYQFGANFLAPKPPSGAGLPCPRTASGGMTTTGSGPWARTRASRTTCVLEGRRATTGSASSLPSPTGRPTASPGTW